MEPTIEHRPVRTYCIQAKLDSQPIRIQADIMSETRDCNNRRTLTFKLDGQVVGGTTPHRLARLGT